MFNLRVLCQDHPQRTIALVTADHALIFHYSAADASARTEPRCQVEFSDIASVDLKNYRSLGAGYGTLGLITLNQDVFVCVVTAFSQAATVKPGEAVSRIDSVDFYCLNRSDYEYGLDLETGSQFAAEGRVGQDKDVMTDHPFLALKKLLSDGSFYYSLDFNLTDRLQDRVDQSAAFDIDTLDEDMLWNSYMINPLLLFRSHLPPSDKAKLDACQLLTCVMRGYASTLKVPATVSILPQVRTNFPSLLTIISRQSSRRAGTRFNSRGIDDDGHVANFVESELILWVAPGIAFSYVQVRGSVPIFWEQTPGLIPGQQKIEITRSSEATQHAFNQHFEALELEYGAVHVVNLLSELKPGEASLSAKYRKHIAHSSLRKREGSTESDRNSLLRLTEYDFHAETRGIAGYEASNEIKYELAASLNGFAHFISEDTVNSSAPSLYGENDTASTSSVILQQEGVFRTNCLDCLDRTNLVQTIISSMALESFISQQGGRFGSDMQMRHSTLWADNGDALSKIYAGTGALKSSFTRHGKMSFAGALADVRKSATRLYVNNFTDKARQNTIDLLLGRLANQIPVYLYDPINEVIIEELTRRASEYSSSENIRIWVGTFNVNGRDEGPGQDLTPWLFPDEDGSDVYPTIFAVGFQEIVDLSPQQIMSTDPGTRKVWERAVHDCLNNQAKMKGTGKYVLLRSGQLVGAALMIFVKSGALKDIKNVEGTVKKTGLSGIAGNKGGCAIRFELCNTSLCFVTAHLAAGFANYEDRNRDYETISGGLRFQRNRFIADHDSIFWFGDFNYRIGLGNQIVRDLVSQADYQRLYENDQLNLQMIAGRAFQFYSEGSIDFAPTYKYDVGTEIYDTSDKGRIPAWCDRVLWKGSNLRQTHYSTADLRVSDHRPVWTTFDVIIDVVDHELKDSIRRQIYETKNDDAFSDSVHLLDLDDEDSMPHVSIAPGLPPASSDRNRWWLDNGAPVKATVQPPEEGFVANIQRKSNPFSRDTEPDWVSRSDSMKSARVSGKKTPPRRDSSQKPRVEKSPPVVPRKPIELSSQCSPRSPIDGSANKPLSTSTQSSNMHSAGTNDLLGDSGEEIEWKALLPQ